MQAGYGAPKSPFSGCRPRAPLGKATRTATLLRAAGRPGGVKEPCMHGNLMHENREVPETSFVPNLEWENPDCKNLLVYKGRLSLYTSNEHETEGHTKDGPEKEKFRTVGSNHFWEVGQQHST